MFERWIVLEILCVIKIIVCILNFLCFYNVIKFCFNCCFVKIFSVENGLFKRSSFGLIVSVCVKLMCCFIFLDSL